MNTPRFPYPIIAGLAIGAAVVAAAQWIVTRSEKRVYEEAITFSAGHYEANPTNGVVRFIWHSCPPR